jgi:hypothetical protein
MWRARWLVRCAASGLSVERLKVHEHEHRETDRTPQSMGKVDFPTGKRVFGETLSFRPR